MLLASACHLDPQALSMRFTHVNYGDKPLTGPSPVLPLTGMSACSKLCGERARKSMRSEIVSRRVKRLTVFLRGSEDPSETPARHCE